MSAASTGTVAGEATATARRIVELRERHRRLIVEHFGRVAAGALKVLESLYSQPIVSVLQVQKITGSSFPAANDLVKRFTQRGILTEQTGQTRNRRFRYDAYIAIFSNEDAPGEGHT